MPRSPLPRRDPSRTLTLRRTLGRELGKLFRALGAELRGIIYTQDRLGLTGGWTGSLILHEELVPPGRLQMFGQWLRERLGRVVQRAREVLGKYIPLAYRVGIGRAVKDTPTGEPPSEVVGIPGLPVEQLIPRSSRARAEVQGLEDRAVTEVQTLVDTLQGRVLIAATDAVTQGWTPEELWQDVREQVQKVIGQVGVTADGVVIRSHATGQLQAFAALGVERVGTVQEQVTWKTAGDSRVCKRCASMAGRVFTLAEATGLIPLHNLCRCVWVPA